MRDCYKGGGNDLYIDLYDGDVVNRGLVYGIIRTSEGKNGVLRMVSTEFKKKKF